MCFVGTQNQGEEWLKIIPVRWLKENAPDDNSVAFLIDWIVNGNRPSDKETSCAQIVESHEEDTQNSNIYFEDFEFPIVFKNSTFIVLMVINRLASIIETFK
ncbi:hypothetical protein FKM82_019581 [Ascaphus truei]